MTLGGEESAAALGGFEDGEGAERKSTKAAADDLEEGEDLIGGDDFPRIFSCNSSPSKAAFEFGVRGV